VNESDRPQIDLLQMWLKGGHESLSDEERAALDQLVLDSPKARETLIMLGQQEAWLMWHSSRAASAGELAAQQDLSEEHHAKDLSLAAMIDEPLIAAIESGAKPAAAGRMPIAFSRWMIGMGHAGGRSLLTFALGVLVAICLVQGWWIYRGIDSTAARPNVSIAAKPVAYLAVENGCSWRDSMPSLRGIGSGVRQGDEIALQEGIAEFRLTSGVYLSVEGPAALVVTSPSSIVLQYGKLTANVPWTVTDFKAIASQCRLTACDAEFGVSLSPGNAEVHVFSGEVQAVSVSWIGERNGSEIQALAGEAARPTSEPAKDVFLSEAVIAQGRSLALRGDDGDLKIAAWGEADETRFATRLPMAWPLPVTQTYVDAVLQSKPWAYWRLESVLGSKVKSEVASGCDLDVVGNFRLAGSPENHFAEFGRPDTNSLLVSSRPLDELANTNYSVEVWVKASHLHCGSIMSLIGCTADQQEAHALYLELQGARGRVGSPFTNDYPGRIRFLHRTPPSRNAKTGSSCFSEQPYRVRRWHHVVAVKDAVEMKLFVDGELVSRVPEATLLPTQLTLAIGQHTVGIRTLPFFGQLDELAIYTHALSGEEISGHYQSINWSPERNQPEKSKKFISVLPRMMNSHTF
jgi:hypothetical protein